jgi:hypothetical protein
MVMATPRLEHGVVGDEVGDQVGESVGDWVGDEVVGEPVGELVGDEVVGDPVGEDVGDEVVGDPVGEDVGDEVVGDSVGEDVGDEVVGDPVGEDVGDEVVGESVGEDVGDEVVGDPVGEDVGDEVVGESVGEDVGDEVVGDSVGEDVGDEVVGDPVGEIDPISKKTRPTGPPFVSCQRSTAAVVERGCCIPSRVNVTLNPWIDDAKSPAPYELCIVVPLPHEPRIPIISPALTAILVAIGDDDDTPTLRNKDVKSLLTEEKIAGTVAKRSTSTCCVPWPVSSGTWSEQMVKSVGAVNQNPRERSEL